MPGDHPRIYLKFSIFSGECRAPARRLHRGTRCIYLKLSMPATQYKRMLQHSWDSPRNSHFDLLKLVLAQGNIMYWELAPSEGQSQCPATIPAFVSNSLVFYCSNQRVSHEKGLCPQSEWLRTECSVIAGTDISPCQARRFFRRPFLLLP